MWIFVMCSSTESASESAILSAEDEVATAKKSVDTAVKDINDAWTKENSMSLLAVQQRGKNKRDKQSHRLRARGVSGYEYADEMR